MTRHEVYESMSRTQREFRVARHLVLAQIGRGSDGWQDLPRGVGLADLRGVRDSLPATYLLRLFSKFEAGLRSLWLDHYRRTTSPMMEVLMNRVAANLAAPTDVVDAAHEVRRTRNNVVHVGEVTLPFPWPEAHRRLRQFVSYAPVKW